jgi:AbrB family looped-hinge helix DNA binding protein
MRATKTHLRAVATVTSKGQVTIPRVVRRALGLGTGSQLHFELARGHAFMAPHHIDLADLFLLVPARPRRRRMSLTDMERAIRAGATRGSL